MSNNALNSILAALGNAGFPDEAAQIIEAAKSLDDYAQDEGVETKTMEIEKIVSDTIKGIDWKSIIAPIVETVVADTTKKTVDEVVAEAVSNINASIDQIAKRVDVAEKAAEAASSRTDDVLNAVKAQAENIPVAGRVEVEQDASQQAAISATAAKLDGAARAVSAFGTALFTRGQ